MKNTEKNGMKIAGIISSHDCSFAVLEDGKPIVHAELERYIRLKEPKGDAYKFLTEEYADFKDIKYFAHPLDIWRGGPSKWYPDSWSEIKKITEQNDGKLFFVGHHKCHAANAFFSSNMKDALIITIDGGGTDLKNNEPKTSTITVWEGKDNKIEEIKIIEEVEINIGSMWSYCTERIFGLSRGYPKGNQCGTVMAMACMGDPSVYYDEFYNHRCIHPNYKFFDFEKFRIIAERSEKDRFDVAAALQKSTEDIVKEVLDPFVKNTKSKNLCLSGGVVFNSVMTWKLTFDWYKEQFDKVYVCPVPYDAGLAIGAAQYIWHQHLNNPRIKWEDNFTPYLGFTYDEDQIQNAIKDKNNLVTTQSATKKQVADLLAKSNIISVFSAGSESGRRALGNRSILADPRNPDMKDIINEKVKHRQWFRPFAPSILREKVSEWFEHDISSPYMSFVVPFKEEVRDKVPAVVHFDGTARLQTVTENDNKWYYDFLKTWEEVSGVPIVLNTSFNDREPIVETPEHAINCFLKTDIDYLYFADFEILVSKL